MDSKKLVKVIKALVEAEVSKRQEVFLKKTFPKILDEAVKARMKTITSNKTKEVDPFSLANAVLDENRKESQPVVENQTYTKNPMLNQVLNETLQSGVTDTMDKTVTFGTHNVAAAGGGTPVGQSGIQSFREEMAQKMGLQPMGQQSAPQPQGLGVQTGVPGLDKILNRDNSELVKAMTRKRGVGA